MTAAHDEKMASQTIGCGDRPFSASLLTPCPPLERGSILYDLVRAQGRSFSAKGFLPALQWLGY